MWTMVEDLQAQPAGVGARFVFVNQFGSASPIMSRAAHGATAPTEVSSTGTGMARAEPGPSTAVVSSPTPDMATAGRTSTADHARGMPKASAGRAW